MPHPVRPIVWLAPLLALAACEGADSPASPDAGSTSAPDARVEAEVDAAPPAARCTGLGTPEADRTLTLTHDGRERTYHVYLPPSYDPTEPTALVFNFHGYTSNATQQQLLSGAHDVADAAGFIVVHPEGVGAQPSWNAGGVCCGTAAAETVDDVGFVGAMLDALSAELCVDPARVYATGMSNGGFLSHRLACELSDRIAAIAPVAGVIAVTDCDPGRAVPVLQFHGTADTIVPYNGDPSNGFPSVADTMAGWADRNGCAGEPTETFREGVTRCDTWNGCEAGAEIVLCTSTGAGHTWPGGFPVPSLGHTTNDISATEAAWEFFTRHPHPSPRAE
jgi:polyhydroxybutyrate depolymerase